MFVCSCEPEHSKRTVFLLQDPADINYSLVIVGYNDTDVANSYWIARAAFGQDFGLDGHVHIVCGRCGDWWH